jgi:hypothetical protein
MRKQRTLVRMRKITFRADKRLIAQAKRIARAHHKTLNAVQATREVSMH